MQPKFTAILITALCLVAVVESQEVSTDDTNYQLMVSSHDPPALQILGKQRITCRSRWHDLRIPCKIRGRLNLKSEDLTGLLPDTEVAIAQPWKVSETPARELGEQLFSAIKISATESATYAYWIGSHPQPNPVKATAQLTGVLESITGDGDHRIANIRITGDLQITESGKMASRFGPNWWKSNWLLKLNMNLAINMADGQLKDVHCSCRGGVKGVYSNDAGIELTEPFTATVIFRVFEPKPLSPEQLRRVEELIKKLDDKRFAVRERATDELRQLGPNVSECLQNAIESARSPESRSRLRSLVNEWSE